LRIAESYLANHHLRDVNGAWSLIFPSETNFTCRCPVDEAVKKTVLLTRGGLEKRLARHDSEETVRTLRSYGMDEVESQWQAE
jgi:hypothetical protein